MTSDIRIEDFAQGQIELRSAPELVEELKALTIEIQELYCQDQLPWIVGYSGGKDSTAALQLVWNAIATLPPEKRTKTVHVITTDTMVENPVVSAWVDKSLTVMGAVAKEQNMPIEPILLKPAFKDTFHPIGKGYPCRVKNFTMQARI